MAHHSKHHVHSAGNVRCQNCDTELKGPFCHACGQHDFDLHRSFGHVFLETLESFLHFDGKVFTDTWTLLTKPGQLTREFNAGRRQSHVPPLRFYIFVSLVFFVWLSFKAHHDGSEEAVKKAFVTAEAGDSKAGHAPKDVKSEDEDDTSAAVKDESHAVTPTPATEPTASAAHDETPEGLKDLEKRFRKAGEDPAAYRDAIMHLVPKMMLVCLPLFALGTRVLFRKSGLNYLQHLVASLHLHTFVYLYWLIFSVVDWPLGHFFPTLSDLVGLAVFGYLCYYLFKSLRTLYGGTRLRVFVKAGLLGTVYGLTIGVGFMIIGYLSAPK